MVKDGWMQEAFVTNEVAPRSYDVEIVKELSTEGIGNICSTARKDRRRISIQTREGHGGDKNTDQMSQCRD